MKKMKTNKLKKAILVVLIVITTFTVKGTEVYKSIDQNWFKQNNTDILIDINKNKISIISDETITYFVYNPSVVTYNNVKVYSMRGIVGDDTCTIVLCDYGNGQQLITINTAFGRIKYIIKE